MGQALPFYAWRGILMPTLHRIAGIQAMTYDILILTGTGGDLVSFQQYEGGPGFPATLTFDDEPYDLTLFSLGEKRYLIAHNQPIEQDVAEEVIGQFSPRPV